MDRNDMGDQKGITILDLSTGKIDFSPNKYSPVFKKFSILKEDDVDRLDELKDSKDYIDLSISNNLLISNRKLRRKLETLLEKGGFSSVEYIDDITKDENDDVIIIEESNGDEVRVSIDLDYDDYIREYILKQKYDNEKFKSGILNEFDEVVRIYNENYKNLKD